MDTRYICEAIRLARVSKNWKQSDFSARIGYSQNYYSELERGLHKFTIDHLERIGNALGVDYRELLPPPGKSS